MSAKLQLFIKYKVSWGGGSGSLGLLFIPSETIIVFKAFSLWVGYFFPLGRLFFLLNLTSESAIKPESFIFFLANGPLSPLFGVRRQFGR